MNKHIETIKGALEEHKLKIEKITSRISTEQDEDVKEMLNLQLNKLKEELEIIKNNLEEQEKESKMLDKDWTEIFKKYPEVETSMADTIAIGSKVSYNTNKEAKLAYKRIKSGADSAIIEGPTGTGKTTYFRWVGAKLNRPVMSINASTGMSEDDLIGKYGIGESGNVEFFEGPLMIAMRTGSILVIEEINGSKPSVMLKLNSLLDDLGQIVHPVTKEVIKAEDGFLFGGTLNLGYAGTRKMNKAFINRFKVAFRITQLSETQLKEIIKSKISDVTEDELNVAWYVFKSIDGIINREEFDAAISVRQMISMIETKRLDQKFDNGNLNPSWRAAIALSLRSQVSGFDEEVDSEIEKVVVALGETIDKKTGKLSNSAKPQGEVLEELKRVIEESNS